MEQWAEGRFNSENPSVCTAANIGAIHELNAFKQIIDIEVEDLNESESSEQLGVSSRGQGRAA